MAPAPKKKRKRTSASVRRATSAPRELDTEDGDEVATAPQPSTSVATAESGGIVSRLRGMARKPLTPAGPEWRRRDFLVLSATTAAVLLLLSVVITVTQASWTPSIVLETAAVIPALPSAIIYLAAAVFVAAPIASRIAKRRRLRFFEWIAYAAVLAFACALATAGAVQIVGASNGTSGGKGSVGLFPALVVADVLGFAAAAVAYPPVGRVLRGTRGAKGPAKEVPGDGRGWRGRGARERHR